MRGIKKNRHRSGSWILQIPDLRAVKKVYSHSIVAGGFELIS